MTAVKKAKAEGKKARREREQREQFVKTGGTLPETNDTPEGREAVREARKGGEEAPGRVKLPALPKLPKAARKPKAKRSCLCGCGQQTASRFCPGHDSRLKGWALRVERGVVRVAEIPDGEREAVVRFLSIGRVEAA